MSNAQRFGAEPVHAGGTSVHAWRAADLSFPELDVATCPALVVVAPHPDDETLGFGATAAAVAAHGVPVRVVSVSDGDAAYPGATSAQRQRLAEIRRAEVRCATAALGLDDPVRLGLPDGAVAAHESELVDALAGMLADGPAGVWCAATWCGDGHPDHEAVGRAASAAAARTGATLLEYPVWMWHWARPGEPAVPWARAYRPAVSPAAVERKRAAAQCFRSQFEPDGHEPVLPATMLERLLTVGEVVFR